MSQLNITNLTKTFGSIKALDNVSLCFQEEKIYGLLGRNGAGKSTLLNIITNRLHATSGQVQIGGENVWENDRAQANMYMTGEFMTHPVTMRINEVFRWTSLFYDGAFDMGYALKLCNTFGLDPKKKIRQLSTGYKSIYKIITALALEVPFLLLDEPVLGLDANHRDLLYKIIIENFANKPRTLIISTHLIEEIASLIEEVIIIKEGRIIHQAPSEELLAMGYAISGPAGMVDAYTAGKQRIGEDALGGLKTAYIMGTIDHHGIPEQLEVSRMDLQKLFIQLTNQ